MSTEYPTRSNHSSIFAKSSLFARTASIGIGSKVILAAHDAAHRLRGLDHRGGVAREVRLGAPEPLRLDEGARGEAPDVVGGDHLQLRRGAHRGDELVALQEPGETRFSMKKTGRRMTCDGNFSSRTVASIRALLSK